MPGARCIHNNHQTGEQPRHDEPEAEALQVKNYFTPGRFYCVETICAPCGVVIAWAKFSNAESPTNILNFLENVYSNEQARPDYICINKACKVLRTAIASGRWESWKKTSRFIVDTYHYQNHRTSDYLCRKWCNPAPLNGTAPNLVVVAQNRNGESYYKRAFNTQACEQLNAWLGGFESILQHMTIDNFNWFLHSMFIYHTQHVIDQQNRKAAREGRQTDEVVVVDDDDDDDDEILE